MQLYKTFSKQQIARILGVNRGTIYSWESHGFPVRPPERPGRSARVDFDSALEWFLDYQEMKGVSDEGLAILEEAIRTRKERFYGGKS
jgi:transposase